MRCPEREGGGRANIARAGQRVERQLIVRQSSSSPGRHMIGRWIDRGLAALRSELERARGASRDIAGIKVDVLNTRDDIDTEQVFRRAERVLALVERYQPWRLAHLRRDLTRIL